MTETVGAGQPAPLRTPGSAYASIGRRIGADVLDAVASLLVLVFLGAAPAMLADNAALFLIGYAGSFVLGIVQWVLVGTRGYSIGKAMLGIRVVDAETGRPIGLGRALLRYLVLSLLSACFVLLIVLLFVVKGDPRRQGWHDKAARSVVLDLARSAAPAAEAAAPAAWPTAPTPYAGPLTPDPVAPPPPPAAVTGPPPAAESPRPVAPPPAAPVAPPPAPPLPAGGLVGPPPGLIAPPPRHAAEPPAAQPAASAVPAAPAVDPIDEVTRRPHDGVTPTPRVQPRTWVLRPRTGADHVLEGATVVGRDPDATAHGRATPWRVDDPAFTVSKTHALVTLVNGSPWIEDLDSTHGVVIRRNGDEASIAPRTPTRLLPADVIVLGAFEIAVDAVA